MRIFFKQFTQKKMALNNVNFVKGASGLGRPLEGEDHISGVVFYTDSLPSGFGTSDRIKKVYSKTEAEDLGIVNTSTGETKAVAKVVIGGTPAVGDTLKITYTGIEGIETVLSTYSLVSGEVGTTTDAAAAYKAQINLGTATHGFSADNTTNSLFITTKTGEGIFPNSGTPYAVTVTGANTATLTQPTGSGSTVLGIASKIDAFHYHISEFFRMQPKGIMYIGIYAVPSGAYDFAELALVRDYANGSIRQMGTYVTSLAYTTAHITALQAIATASSTAFKPFSIVYQGDISGTASVMDLLSVKTFSAPNVSVLIGQDGDELGYHLFKACGKSIGTMGTALGATAFAKVSESIAWVEKFNLANTEFEMAGFANGQLFRNLTDNQLSALNSNGFIFLVKFTGYAGTFFNDTFTATVATSDYSTIENNRTQDKAIRNIRVALLPKLNSPLLVDPLTGYLSEDTISLFENICNVPLETMAKNGELSGYVVTINPIQNVLSTSKLVISILNVPTGVARNIEFNIGFTTNIS
jgi:hypothetical protein